MAEAKLNARLGLDKKEFDSKLKQAEGSVGKFGNSLKSLAATAGLAFGLREIFRFGTEVVKLGAKTEGVKRAFDRLNNPALLFNLRQATKNTVADVDLMSAAVRANNFNIALENLPKYFQFASQRARDTGESVDYLVESIIMGIGRKSPLIMDNLGISLAEINEELKKTPDFASAVGRIIEKNLGDAADNAEIAADKIESLGAAWKNLMSNLGQNLGSGGIGKFIGGLAKELQIQGDQTLTNKQARYFLWHKKEYDKFLEFRAELASLNAPQAQTAGDSVDTIATLKNELDGLEALLQQIPITRTAEIKSTLKDIEAKKKQIDTIMGVTEAVKENNRTIMDSEQLWNTLVLPGQAGQQMGGTWGALAGSFANPNELAKTTEASTVVLENWRDNIGEITLSIAQSFDAVGDAMASAMSDGAVTFSEAMNVISQTALAAIPVITALASAQLISAEASKGLVGIFTAVAGVGLILATVAQAKQTKFADGGIVYGPTNALVGEYAGARSNPEVIAPLDKLKGLIGGGQTIKIIGRTRGTDIYWTNARGGNSIYQNT